MNTEAIDPHEFEYLSYISLEVKERLTNDENGLLPAILIKGSDPVKYNIQERMRHYRIPGVSIAVINNGKLEWAKAYGVKQNGTENPVTITTLFQAASITKPMVAAAVLHLAEKGLIDLDAPVNEQLTSWKIPANEFTAQNPVTPKMLILHTGGVTGLGFDGYSIDAKIPTLLQILDGLDPANSPPIRVDATPGANWRYSGGGYLILQQLMQDVTHKTFSNLLNDIILEPLNMTNSFFSQPLMSEQAKAAATGHTSEGEIVVGKWRIYPELAAGGLWSNPIDLCRFIVELQQSLDGNANQFLSKPMTEYMLSRQFINMGLGFVLGGKDENLSFTFNGGNAGYRCSLFAYASKGQGAVIMTNSDQGDFIIGEIFRSISAEYEWADHKPQIKEMAEVE